MTTQAPAKPKQIRYASSDLLAQGIRHPWSEDEDNPFSPNFVPVGEGSGTIDPVHQARVRSERARARWWALHAKKRRHPTSGVFDE